MGYWWVYCGYFFLFFDVDHVDQDWGQARREVLRGCQRSQGERFHWAAASVRPDQSDQDIWKKMPKKLHVWWCVALKINKIISEHGKIHEELIFYGYVSHIFPWWTLNCWWLWGPIHAMIWVELMYRGRSRSWAESWAWRSSWRMCQWSTQKEDGNNWVFVYIL